MPRAVHISACVVLLAAITSADTHEGITIHITGPATIVNGCHDSTKEQCSGEEGFCVETGDRCNGTFKILHNSCTDHCTCCVPDNQVGCSVDEGFFMLPESTQCFKAFRDQGSLTWTAAEAMCKAAGLELAKPDDAAVLQKYLNERYPGIIGDYWVGARADGSSFRWQRGSEVLDSNSPLWFPGDPRDLSTDHCLSLLATDGALIEAPGQPYVTGDCSVPYNNYPLCEVIME